MTNEEIFKKALDKAHKNGFPYKSIDVMRLTLPSLKSDSLEYYDPYMMNTIIYSHYFSKAFWGEEEHKFITIGDKGFDITWRQPAWKYHLQQMVLEENPYKYLEKFI